MGRPKKVVHSEIGKGLDSVAVEVRRSLSFATLLGVAVYVITA